MVQTPTTYPPIPDEAIASYSGTDLATGSGNAIFYLMDDINTNYFLSSVAGFSNTGFKNNTAAIDLDFDVLINKAIIFEGLAVAEISVADASGANPHTPTMVVKIRHWDGTTETDIVTSSGSKTIAANSWSMWTHRMVVPRTYFAVGDTLRITVTLTIRGDVNREARFWFDPSNGSITATILSTASKVSMPVRTT